MSKMSKKRMFYIIYRDDGRYEREYRYPSGWRGWRNYETAGTFKRAQRWVVRMGAGAVIERRIRGANGRVRYQFFVYNGGRR